MNPLGQLPASSSDGASLNKMDWLKVLRMLLVQLISIFLTMAVPAMTKATYVYHGKGWTYDFTPYVLIVVSCIAELGRRWLAGQNPAPAQQVKA